MASLVSLMRRAAGRRHLARLRSSVLEVRNLSMLKKAMGWDKYPDLDFEHLYQFEHLTDLNDRRLRDAEVVGSACCNGSPKTILEIGTGRGLMTAVMARNAPQATVYTVNIPPEEIAAGGKHVTFAPDRSEIGSYYRELGLTNVQQIYANTATWEPDFGPIDVAFIDGCHDADYVFRDTAKLLAACHPGSVILWHDFSPALCPIYGWIDQVCSGIDALLSQNIVTSRILHLQDSWVGMCHLA
jgi:hypothetical protein